MELLFKNKTKYTKNIYEEYLKFHYNKYHNSYMFYTIIIGLLIFFCVGINVKYHNYPTAVIFCIILTIFIIWRLFHPSFEVQNDYNSETISKELSFTFKFYKNYFIITDRMHYSKIKYAKLYRIFETNTFFYLYIDKNHSFLIDKKGFIKGTSNDFSEFINKKCIFKYKKSVH